MRITIFWPIGIAFSLMSCTDKPLVAPRPITFQQKFETSEHWQQLASKNVHQLIAALKNIPDPKQGGHLILSKSSKMPPLTNRPFYISTLNSGAPFGRAYREFLIEEINKNNLTISTTSKNATVVNVRVQVLEYNGPNRARTIPGPLGIWSSVLYYGYQTSKWSSTADQLAVGIAVGTVLDAYLFMTDTPNAEVVVTTAVVGENSYHYLKTDRYYVDLENVGIYKSYFGPAPFIITRSMPVASAPVVNVPLSKN